MRRRARRRAAYRADPVAKNYERTRYALRARIVAKATRIKELETELAA